MVERARASWAQRQRQSSRRKYRGGGGRNGNGRSAGRTSASASASVSARAIEPAGSGEVESGDARLSASVPCVRCWMHHGVGVRHPAGPALGGGVLVEMGAAWFRPPLQGAYARRRLSGQRPRPPRQPCCTSPSGRCCGAPLGGGGGRRAIVSHVCQAPVTANASAHHPSASGDEIALAVQPPQSLHTPTRAHGTALSFSPAPPFRRPHARQTPAPPA